MKKIAILLTIAILFSASTAAQTTSGEESDNHRFIPGDLFYPVESFVEDIEVTIAGVVGGPEFKSKAIANNADEALNEARALANSNRGEEAAEMVQRYSQMMNQSRSLAEKSEDGNLSDKLQNISEKNIEKLQQVRGKVPQQAQKGIDNAINQSKKAKGPIDNPEVGERPLNKPNTDRQNKAEGQNVKPDIVNKSRGKANDSDRNLTDKPAKEEKALNSTEDFDLESKNSSGNLLDEKEGSEGQKDNKNDENQLNRTGSGLL